MAVFVSASDALTAAVEAQQAVYLYNERPDALAAMSVRMGLSVGDVSWENGDCFGTPVVEAARLVAEAEGGQILCSDFVRFMARGRGGHCFSVLGARTLKGLPDPVETCAVTWEPPEHLPERLPFPHSLVVRSSMAFVGREDELVEAERLLETADGTTLLWLVGEPGIGKTRLAAELARRAHDRGCDVLAGRCDEDLVVPFQPFVHALRDFVTATPTAGLLDRLGRQPTELARLHPDLSFLVPGLDPPPPVEPAMERYRLFEAVRSWLGGGGGGRPRMLVLDDLHWADSATLALLGYLGRATDPVPLLIVGTLRDTEPDTGELHRLLDDLAPRSTTMRLGGLDTAGVTRLVELVRSPGWDATGLARQIEQETGGNPLFVSAVLAGLEPGRRPAGISSDVAAAVHRRLTRLPPGALDLLRVAAVMGLEFELRVVSAVLELPLPAGLEMVDAAIRGHLVEETGVDQYRFAHALVRSALRQEIGVSRVAHYHCREADALEVIHEGRLDDHLDELAYHYGQALPSGGPSDRALYYTLAAADRATAQYASQTAAERYRQALELLDAGGQPGDDRRCKVLVALGKAELDIGDFEGARATLRKAALDAETAGLAELMTEAAWYLEQATTYPGLPTEDAVDLLRRALGRLDPADTSLRARAMTSLARSLGRTPDYDEAVDVLDQAVAMARRTNDRAALAGALYAISLTRIGPRDIGVRLASATEALDVARLDDNPYVRSYAASVKAFPLLETGRMVELKQVVAELADQTVEVPMPFSLFAHRTLAGTVALVDGRLGEAAELAAAAREAGRELTGIDPDGIYGLQMFGVRREQGCLDVIAGALRTLVGLGDAHTIWRPGLAALHAELGLAGDAREVLESLVTPDAVLIPFDSRRSLSLSYLADAATFVADRQRSSVLYRELLPYAELCIANYHTTCYGPASRYLGMLATTLGRFDEAAAHFQDALIRCESLQSPLWATHTRYHLARMLLTRRRPADADYAERLTRTAQETAAQLGMRAMEERSGRLLASGLDVIPQT
jgi:tetratricopeptide (TPR) repeat protein